MTGHSVPSNISYLEKKSIFKKHMKHEKKTKRVTSRRFITYRTTAISVSSTYEVMLKAAWAPSSSERKIHGVTWG